MAEISDIKPTTRSIEILHPVSEEPIGLRIGVLPINDPSIDKTKRRMLDKRLDAEKRGKSWKAEDREDGEREFLFALTTGWEWYNPKKPGDENYDPDGAPTFHGEVPDYNRRNFDRVTDELRWISAQVQKSFDDEKAFFEQSKPN